MTDMSSCLSHRILFFLHCRNIFCFSITVDRHDVCDEFRSGKLYLFDNDRTTVATVAVTRPKGEKTKRDLPHLFCAAWQYISRRARYPATDRRPSVCCQCRKFSKSRQYNYGVLSRPKERLLSPCPGFRGHSKTKKSAWDLVNIVQVLSTWDETGFGSRSTWKNRPQNIAIYIVSFWVLFGEKITNRF